MITTPLFIYLLYGLNHITVNINIEESHVWESHMSLQEVTTFIWGARQEFYLEFI